MPLFQLSSLPRMLMNNTHTHTHTHTRLCCDNSCSNPQENIPDLYSPHPMLLDHWAFQSSLGLSSELYVHLTRLWTPDNRDWARFIIGLQSNPRDLVLTSGDFWWLSLHLLFPANTTSQLGLTQDFRCSVSTSFSSIQNLHFYLILKMCNPEILTVQTPPPTF